MWLLGEFAQLIKNIDAWWAARWLECTVPSYGNLMVTDLAKGLRTALRYAFSVEIELPRHQNWQGVQDDCQAKK